MMTSMVLRNQARWGAQRRSQELRDAFTPESVAIGPGIEADSISLVHLSSRLEGAVGMGFALPMGDDMEPVYQ